MSKNEDYHDSKEYREPGGWPVFFFWFTFFVAILLFADPFVKLIHQWLGLSVGLGL